ncbi:mothers against decapentaplegic homolog 6-like [Synchiropus splendidus]|uniref:mothers against decapentaplegic homolog 6-like n=1 Tax=Synchiropus splendidus TaxID=270530 RepID=UPI00237DA865|nr:mothers against decapentaplegic homolog 6-like [Synchiropus splendidus]
MFKSKRAGLVRRLWRNRLVTEGDGRDGSGRGEGGRSGQCGRKIRRSEQVTRADPGLGEAGGLGDAEDEEQADDDRGLRNSPGRHQEEDSRTVTCCLFGEWDRRPRSPNRGRCHGQEEEMAGATCAFLRKLKEKSLEVLVKTVETKGAEPSECVMVPNTPLRLGAQQVSPQYLLCRTFRWSDLQFSSPLKTLSPCQNLSGGDQVNVCCNPYHYSRLCGPESPPPPYSCSDEHKPLDSALFYTETVPPAFRTSQTTPRDYADTGTSLGSSTSSGLHSHWCSVAYWEHRTRVGRLYPAYDPSLSIFYDLPQGTGLCLGQLQANAYHNRRADPGSHHSSGSKRSSSSSVQQIRCKIGFGIVLSQETDGVWVYNRSQHPIFVHSPTLDLLSACGFSVKRVMPGFSLKMFDYECSSWMREHGVKPESQEGPWDPHSIRISFAKGWGPCYSRQFITSCPCWLEVLLNNHR